MQKKPKIHSYRFGVFAEFIVVIFLRLKFYQIIANRYKTSFGEIDIIAKKGKKLVIVEVKARKLKRDEILVEEMLRKKQLERIKAATKYFLARNKKYRDFDVRFDFIFVGKNYLPIHYKSFFN